MSEHTKAARAAIDAIVALHGAWFESGQGEIAGEECRRMSSASFSRRVT